GHCKRLQPIWEELATDLKGKVNVGKVNCEEEIALTTRFQVSGYPSIYYVENGNVWEYLVSIQ
ncbi:unnamed protein product, partial [Discosporangium mesarthrocarpum]